MSRPNESEPMRKTCFCVSPSSVVISPSAPGSRSRLPASNRDGSTVPSHGAATATSTSSTSTLAPMRTDQLLKILLIANSRIEEQVGKIHQQVDEHVGEGE